jgi:hypothetical protein
MARIKHRFKDKEVVWATSSGGVAVQYKDIFQIGDLVTEMHDWLVENLDAPGSDADFPEKFYHHRFHQNGLEEVRFWWRLSRKINSFITYRYDIEMRTLAMVKKEVMHRGMKFKSNHADCEIRVWGFLELQKNAWQKGGFLTQTFYEMFRGRMYADQVRYHRNEVVGDVNRLIAYLKDFFKLKNIKGGELQGMYTNIEFE